jgi:hypothetical protein
MASRGVRVCAARSIVPGRHIRPMASCGAGARGELPAPSLRSGPGVAPLRGAKVVVPQHLYIPVKLSPLRAGLKSPR